VKTKRTCETPSKQGRRKKTDLKGRGDKRENNGKRRKVMPKRQKKEKGFGAR